MCLFTVNCLAPTQPTLHLIPVLVTGIQSSRVCAAERVSSSPRLGMGLDPCDEHRGCLSDLCFNA
jgi:hypothetical protein